MYFVSKLYRVSSLTQLYEKVVVFPVTGSSAYSRLVVIVTHGILKCSIHGQTLRGVLLFEPSPTRYLVYTIWLINGVYF